MRELIRPALLLVARFGLFLSVVAWVGGQKRAVALVVKVFGLGVSPNAWVVDLKPQPATFYWEIWRVADYPLLVEKHAEAVIRYDTTTHVLVIQHWLTFTIFALFYAVLKWVYRKRGTEVADE